jgi:hypothetical protein
MLSLTGQTPKDHRKDNLNFIKAKQEEMKRTIEEQAKPKPEPFKMKKFTNVQSKLSLITTNETSPDKERPKTAASCRAKSASIVAFGRTSHQEEDVHEHHHVDNENVNHLNLENPSIEQTPLIEKHKAFGKVPQYLERIKSEMKTCAEKLEEERLKARMPPGTRLMTENERIKTLEELQHQKTDVSDLLFSLPLSLKTEALKAKKRELEAKLVEIERAITTFSRKVVYIKDDGHEVDPKAGIFPIEVAYQKPPTPLKRSTKAPVPPSARK